MVIIALIALILGGLWLLHRPRYDRRGFVCIFSKDNQLITVYQNERIPL